MDDFLAAICLDPERSWASHKDLVFQGPSFKLPISPDAWGIREYIWYIDGNLALLAELARTRLCYARMINNPPAQPIAEMSIKLKRWRSVQSHERFIYEDCENRPEHLRYLKAMEKELEKVLASTLDRPAPYVPRYKLSNITLEVTGATRLRLKRLSPAMSAAALLKETEVADSLPNRKDYELIPLTREHILAPPSPARDAARHAENDRRSREYRSRFDAAWRSLTDSETAAILQRLKDSGQ
jgi:hypothetical protein